MGCFEVIWITKVWVRIPLLSQQLSIRMTSGWNRNQDLHVEGIDICLFLPVNFKVDSDIKRLKSCENVVL